MQKPNIHWEKFYDPFEDLENEIEHDKQAPDDEKYSDGYEDIGGMLPFQSSKPRRGFAYILTPQGPLPLTENNKPSVVWNLWVLHIDVDLTTDLKDKIKLVSGVELLNVLSRYRTLISIGKVFEPDKVKVDIESVICDYAIGNISVEANNMNALMAPEPLAIENIEEVNSALENIKTMQDVLSKQADYWVMYVLPNNNMDVATSDSKNDEHFMDRLAIYNEAARNCGGQVITSWDT